MTELTADNVRKIFLKCLHDNGTPQEEALKGTVVKGIMLHVAFRQDRLEEAREEINDLLDCLPDSFHQATGGGWSFLNMCVDKAERQWGEHRDMEHLMLLGMGINRVEYVLPRDVWNALPGGMPYIMIRNRS